MLWTAVKYASDIAYCGLLLNVISNVTCYGLLLNVKSGVTCYGLLMFYLFFN